MIELLSIDLSNYCSKECPFCYNHSTRKGNTIWKTEEVISFTTDCIRNGVKAVSLGGGEPFEYEGVFDVIDALYPQCYLSITSNGIPLENDIVWNQLTKHKPDKIHIIIHHPEIESEVERVKTMLLRLETIGIKPGVNLLVGASKIEAATIVYQQLCTQLNLDQIILIPQRFSNTPSSRQIATVSGGRPFQCPSCLLECKRTENFCSVSWDKKVNSCSFAKGKTPLMSLDYAGLQNALSTVEWVSCFNIE